MVIASAYTADSLQMNVHDMHSGLAIIDLQSFHERLAGAIRGCNIGHKDSLESPQTDVLYFLVKHVLYRKSL
jgi:hypothetical protein